MAVLNLYDSTRDVEGLFVCDLCGHRFEAREALTNHWKDQHEYDFD